MLVSASNNWIFAFIFSIISLEVSLTSLKSISIKNNSLKLIEIIFIYSGEKLRIEKSLVLKLLGLNYSLVFYQKYQTFHFYIMNLKIEENIHLKYFLNHSIKIHVYVNQNLDHQVKTNKSI